MTSNRDESESIILTGCVKKFVLCDEDNFSHQTPYLHLDIPNPHLEVLCGLKKTSIIALSFKVLKTRPYLCSKTMKTEYKIDTPSC